MKKHDQKISNQKSKGGFPRCTFKTNLAIGFCISFPLSIFFTFISPLDANVPILKGIIIVLTFGTLGGFLAGSFSWLMYDFEHTNTKNLPVPEDVVTKEEE